MNLALSFRQRLPMPLCAVVSGLVLAAVLGGAAEANQPATKPTTPPTSKFPASSTTEAIAPAKTKEDNPLEELAKGLGVPATAIAVLAGGWFLFTRGKPIRENTEAWKGLFQPGNLPLGPTPPPITPSAEPRSSVQVMFVNGPSENKLIKEEAVRINPNETLTFKIATHFKVTTASPIEISDIELLYPQINSASPSRQEMKADNCPIEFDYSYRMKTRLKVGRSVDIVLQREFLCKSYLVDENVYGKVLLRIKYVPQSTSDLRVIEARGTLRPGGEMQDITIDRHNEISDSLDGGYF